MSSSFVRGTQAERDRAASALCRACGMCCDGTLFAWVPLSEREAQGLAVLGIASAAREDGSRALRQRCSALIGLDCRVYAERPAPCRSFRCHQLIALSDGEASEAEAQEKVRSAKAELTALAEALGGTSGDVVHEARRRVSAGEASDEVRARLARVDATLRAHFTGRAGR